MKIFILDTNVLLRDAYSIFSFGSNEVVIPAVVMEEMDSKKRLQDEVGRNARIFSRIITQLRKSNKGKLSEGIELDNGGTFRIELNHRSFDAIKDAFGEITNDNRILAVAKNLKDENKNQGKEVVLISNDGLLLAKADVLGIQAEMYENDRLVEESNMAHKGYHRVVLPAEIIDKYYKEKTLKFKEIEPYLKEEVFTQDFFIMSDDSGLNKSALGRLVHQEEKKIIKLQARDDTPSIFGGVTPRNVQQKFLLELLLDDEVDLVCVTGSAGTGKTLTVLAASLQLAQTESRYKRILVARPIVPMGKDLGYLPGEKDEKLGPWMQPIYDNLEFLLKPKEEGGLEKEISNLKIPLQIEALTYIRGRSIPNQIFIIDEAQNLTPHEAKTIISRAGEGTKVILLGDPEQIDHPYVDSSNNGLVYTIEKMKEEKNVGIIHLEKAERSKLAEQAARLL